jgi:eukaryotic translation initiation factor 2C
MILRKTIAKLDKEADRGPLGSAVARNIFFKINAKCGGVNCKIGPTGGQSNTCWTSKFANKQSPTLFIGIDVTHPAPGDTISPSISALVGNVDIDATR